MAYLSGLLNGELENVNLEEIARTPIEALPGISADDARALRRILQIETIGDLGRHEYVVAAVAIASLTRQPTTGGPNTTAHPPASVEQRLTSAALEHLDRTRARIMRGRQLAGDSTDLLRLDREGRFNEDRGG